MTQEKERFRPYAAPANIIAVLQRAKSRNLPEAVTNDFLRITGVGESAFGRVTQTLRFLNLVHEDGRPTEAFEALAGATDTQYREILDKLVRDAYRDELAIIDPGQDPQPRIIDAFQPYQPRSQTSRMVMLFLGLCREAGIPVLDAPRERKMKEPTTRRPRQSVPKSDKQTKQAGGFAYKANDPGKNTSNSTVIFPLTEDDIGILSENEFNEVWTALGKVARARAKAKRQVEESEPTIERAEEEENE